MTARAANGLGSDGPNRHGTHWYESRTGWARRAAVRRSGFGHGNALPYTVPVIITTRPMDGTEAGGLNLQHPPRCPLRTADRSAHRYRGARP